MAAMRSVERRLLGLVFAVGSVLQGAGCGVYSREYEPSAPSTPVLEAPRNGAYLPAWKEESLRPSFSWQPSTSGTNNVRYELQYSSDERFSGDLTTVSIVDTEYQPEVPLEVSVTPPVGRRYHWRVRACVQSTCSEYSASRQVNLGRSEKDLNGDGYADVVVGALNSDEGGTDAGRAYVYFGSAGGIDATPEGVITGANANDRLGTSVAILGDVNGDGFADLAVGAPGADGIGMDIGSVFVYLGGAGTAFDVVADKSISGEFFGEYFGESVSGAGDLNNDGYADVIVAAPLSSGNGTYSGSVYIHFGGIGDALTLRRAKLQGTMAAERFGDSIEAAGDVNGDGFADVLVNRGQASSSCSSSLYLGGMGSLFDASPDLKFVALSPGPCELVMGRAGDVNADGRDDLVAVTRHPSAGDLFFGEAYVYVTPATLVEVLDIVSAAVLVSSVATPVRFMAAVGDINDDGHDDVVADSGALYLGRRDESQPLAIGGALPLSGWRSIEDAGDVNADGVADFVAGRIDGAGAAYLYFGGVGTRLDTVSDATLSNGLPGSGYGFSVATATRKTSRSIQGNRIEVLSSARRRAELRFRSMES